MKIHKACTCVRYVLHFKYSFRLVSGTEDEMPLKINLRTAVRQMKVDGSQGKVTLRLKDGSQVTVDEVVVAVPAPVLAKGDLLFEPSLPKGYQWALSQIGQWQPESSASAG